MKPTFFATAAAFRQWLEKNHDTATELLVGFYKTSSGKPSMSWPESVDQALCFGWIDGVRKSIDEESYMIRFTPRKPGSIWSAVNIKKMEELTAKGLMRPAGKAIFEKRKEGKTNKYSHEQKEAVALDKESEKLFKANKAAWKFFTSQPPSYQKVIIWLIVSAKQPATKLKRLNEAIEASAAGEKVSWYLKYRK
ncbi:YdeI family protein [Chitinophaga sp. CB10]|uniref:YdeI/OmpD-associated family protein n=1 Tax=Chitinophaga sp. CB10 TaxID=1891659 RepID=UPI0025C73DCD|nr:YdeI/OmpD-associated family protein [Chitinophaga sp. CB10]